MTEQRQKGDRVDEDVGKSVDNIASDRKPPSIEAGALIDPSRSGFLRRRKPAKTTEGDEQLCGNKLRTSILQSAKELIGAKGYRMVRNPTAGIDLIASKPIELDGQGYVIDVLPIRLHYESSIVKISHNDCGSQMVKGESSRINSLADELIKNARNLFSPISKIDGFAKEPHNRDVLDKLTEGLETYSVNLLFGKLNCARLKGKNMEFWVNSVILTCCQLQNDLGESRPWVPIPAKLKGLDIDIVGISNLKSYLDFREKEVRILGREMVKPERMLGDFPSQLRTFRILTLSAILTSIVAFLVLVLNTATWFPIAQSGLVLVVGIETYGGWRLLKSYRRLKRDNNNGIGLCSERIAPERLVVNEGKFAPEELSFLHMKYGGAELSKLKKELKTQRIHKLVRKAEDLIKKAERLESEKLYSEAVLSIEKATRSALNAALLLVGSESQARDEAQWTASLENILPKEKFEDLKNLIELRDKVNRGYNSSQREVENAREAAGPILDTTIGRLRSSLKGEYKQSKPLAPESRPSDLCTSVKEKLKRSLEPSPEHDKAQEIEESESSVSNEVINTTQHLKFLLNATDDDELLKLGSAGDYLLRAKKTLETGGIDRSLRTQFVDKDSTNILEELDKLMRSLTQGRPRSRVVCVGKRNPSGSSSDRVVAPDKILPFENLPDFRKVLTRCQLPIVASFLSDDEPSEEVKNAIESLVAKHRAKAAFIVISSKSEEIARECRIKSYPTIIVFNDGKAIGELELTTVEQLEKDMLEMVESATSSDHEEIYDDGIQLRSSKNEVTTTRQTTEQGDGIT